MTERIQIGMRLPRPLHNTLTEVATRSGTSLNGEIEARLARSLESDSDAGRLGQAVAMVAQAAGEMAASRVEGRPAWADDPWTYHQVCFAIMELLRRLAPEGAIVRPEPSKTLLEELAADGSSPEQVRRLAEGIIDRGPSIHTVGYLTSQGKGDFYAGARAFQASLGPKWAGRLKGRKGK